jgi:hypothetical protein
MNTLNNIDNNQILNMIQNEENVQEGLYSYIKNILIYQSTYDETIIDMYIDNGAKINKNILDLLFNEYVIIEYDNIFLRTKILAYIIYICNNTDKKSPLDIKSFYSEVFYNTLKINVINDIILDYMGVDLDVILLLYVNWEHIPLIYNEDDLIINGNEYFLLNTKNILDFNTAKFILFKYYTGYLTDTFRGYLDPYYNSELHEINRLKHLLAFYNNEIERLKQVINDTSQYIDRLKTKLTNSDLSVNDIMILEEFNNRAPKMMGLIEPADLMKLNFEYIFYDRFTSANFYIQFLKDDYLSIIRSKIQIIKETKNRNDLKNKLDILINEFIL